MNHKMIMILGVTASGKGRLAFELARQIDAEIGSVDSMKVYRRMDVGTATLARPAGRSATHDRRGSTERFVQRGAVWRRPRLRLRRSAAGQAVSPSAHALYSKALLYGLFESRSDERTRASCGRWSEVRRRCTGVERDDPARPTDQSQRRPSGSSGRRSIA
jgi:hypothetical protein